MMNGAQEVRGMAGVVAAQAMQGLARMWELLSFEDVVGPELTSVPESWMSEKYGAWKALRSWSVKMHVPDPPWPDEGALVYPDLPKNAFDFLTGSLYGHVRLGYPFELGGLR